MTLKKFYKTANAEVSAIQLAFKACELHYEKWGGQQHAKAGDWLIKQGDECYTVAADSFAKSYEQIEGNRYCKVAPVWAEVATEPGSLNTKEGSTHYQAGDYLVYNCEDKTDGYAISRKKFEQDYREESYREEGVEPQAQTQSSGDTMQMMQAQDYIKSRVDDQIGWYEKKSAWNQSRYKTLQLYAIIFGAMIPLLTAISFEQLDVVLRFAIALLGSLIAIFNAVMSLYKYQENWIQYRSSAESLTREKMLYLTQSAPYTEEKEDSFKLFVERCETIMADENVAWIKSTLLTKEAEKKKNEKPKPAQ